MKKIIYISIIILLNSCQSKINSVPEIQDVTNQSVIVEEKQTAVWEIGQDTILEKNNPKSLDLTKHQLFIDTTRNSKFYKNYLDWKPHKFDQQSTKHYLKELSKKYKPKKISIGDFPTTWITLEKLNNEFVIYDKCDGISPRCFIDDYSVNFYALESDLDIIHDLIKLSKNEIIIDLRTIPQKSKTEKGTLSIKKTDFQYVYLLTFSYADWEMKSIVTPLKHINKFDLIVNNCVEMKRMEYDGFDEINYSDFK